MLKYFIPEDGILQVNMPIIMQLFPFWHVGTFWKKGHVSSNFPRNQTKIGNNAVP
jgi:hypothetical protein